MSRVTRHPLSSIATGRAAGVPVDVALVERLEASFKALRSSGPALVETFYSELFREQASLRGLFPTDMAAQKLKLLAALEMVVGHLRRPETLRARLEELGRRHVAYGAKPEHYPIVAGMLVRAMAKTAGRSWSEQLTQDWTSAIAQVGTIMLGGAGH